MQYSEGFLLDGRYSLKQYVGSGSFGEVWLAHDCETDVDIAVKIYVSMDNQGLEDFKREFQLTFELNHTNLMHALHLGINSEDSRPYLVMPFCPGGSVTKYAGSMDEKTLWRFIRDVASGLAYLHSRTPEIIHQDIKPDNILMMKNGDFVISDFGISKQLKQTLRRSARITDTAGAISYMGPERYGSNPIAVKATDIWAFGISIFEMATGELPFCGQGGIMLKNGAEMPELPSDFSRELNYVMTACLAKETWDRPTAAQVAKYADSILNGETPAPFGEEEKPVKTEVPETPPQKVSDGKKTVRLTKDEREKMKKTVQADVKLNIGKGTVMEEETGVGAETKMEAGGNSVKVEIKKKRFLPLIVAAVLVAIVVVIIIVRNGRLEEQARLDTIRQQNLEIVQKIEENINRAESAMDCADTVMEDRHTYYLDALRFILEAQSEISDINSEVDCHVPDFSDLKASIEDSLSAISLNLQTKAGFFMMSGDTLIAEEYKRQAQEIYNLISK